MTNQPYNPLQKRNLAESIVRAALEQAPRALSDTKGLIGAGVYLLYYSGNLDFYKPLASRNLDGNCELPIYIGKAIPKGGRKGGYADESNSSIGSALRSRLRQHHSSINEASNLDVADFRYRSLVVDEIFISLGENMLIEKYKPVWNVVIEGFGNKTPGARRQTQFRSPWDVLHPGRRFARSLAANPHPAEFYIARLNDFYRTGKTLEVVEESESPYDADESDGVDAT